ncbi:MAG TPA: methionine--tRNA ligase [Candidatus Baltobacteraceae bacterium]|nr:methionine--tRNA ligase [Candidatus Baltobacteraceae bacterium]
MNDRFYVTTPIYYVNAAPHSGHAYTTIVADTASRYHRLAGRQVYFLTGTDEHGDKIAQAAAKAGETPQAYADRISGIFRETWARMGLRFDQFIRTTDPHHKAIVQQILQTIYDKGEIYFSEYGGLYCVGCERFYTEKEAVDGKCPDHQTPLEFVKEQNYFFRMSRYQDWLVRHIQDHPDFIRPERYRNEALAFLREPLEDLCISRPRSRLTWGIPLPFDDRYVTYVWFDALINYVSALDYPNGQLYREFWPVAQHLIAKDILKPHGIYWPTMLQAAGIPVYQHLNIHGYWLMDEAKMSKSRGRVLSPLELADKYGLEALRYFLLREMVFGLDASFSEEALVGRLNADLANNLGNLVQRTLGMVGRYLEGRIPPAGDPISDADRTLRDAAERLPARIESAMATFAFHRALEAIWELLDAGNRYIDSAKPWELAKRDPAALQRVLGHAAEALRIVGLFLSPFMPATSDKIWARLGIAGSPTGARLPDAARWGAMPLGVAAGGDALFPRVDLSAPAPAETSTAPSAAPAIPEISIEEFRRIDLRVATILAAEAVPKSKKLVKLRVSTGMEERTVVAGILEQYAPADLVGKQIVIVANLKPSKLMGVESRGMILAATGADGTIALVAPERSVAPGAQVK